MRSFVICMAVLFSLSMGDVLLDENFNSAWSTGSPPPGWRIFETGPAPGKNDWHPEDAYTAPWTSHPTRYAAIFTDASPEAPPDSLISPVLDSPATEASNSTSPPISGGATPTPTRPCCAIPLTGA